MRDARTKLCRSTQSSSRVSAEDRLMKYFAVIRERGSGWDWSLPMRRQPKWDAHAAFMDALVDDGFLLLGGPLGGEDDAARVLHIVVAPDISAIAKRLAEVPWTAMSLLRTVSIEPWTVLLGKIG
jgi:uncharacterized protein YciI